METYKVVACTRRELCQRRKASPRTRKRRAITGSSFALVGALEWMHRFSTALVTPTPLSILLRAIAAVPAIRKENFKKIHLRGSDPDLARPVVRFRPPSLAAPGQSSGTCSPTQRLASLAWRSFPRPRLPPLLCKGEKERETDRERESPPLPAFFCSGRKAGAQECRAVFVIRPSASATVALRAAVGASPAVATQQGGCR